MDNINSDVIERLRKFVLEHPEMSKSGFIKGLDPNGNIVIIVNGEEKKITIDELESGHLNSNSTVEPQQSIPNPEVSAQPVSNQMSAPVTEDIEVMDATPSNVVPFPQENIQQNTPAEEIEVMNVTPSMDSIPNNPTSLPTQSISNLKEMYDAVLSKNEIAVDKALETFALDNTGKISMNKAIKIVTDNCTNNVIESIKNNTELPSDLALYDVTSKLMSQPTIQNSDDAMTLVDKSFNNILVFVEAARLKNIVYTPEQIEAAKKKYATGIQDRINVLGLNKKPDEIKPDMVKEQPKTMNLELQPDKNLKKAGFADILILTIIVLVYAAIIINLITKLK